MRIEITYYANGDSEFDTEEECLAYETMQRDAQKSIVFFDTPHYERCETPEKIASYGIYAYIIDAESAKQYFLWLYQTYGTTVTHCDYKNGDVLYWDGECDEWFNFTKKIADLTKTYEDVLKAAREATKWTKK